MSMNIDFSASAQFKGHNQKPLWLAQARGLYSPSLEKIAERAVRQDLDMVVLRSYSHPAGTDNRWNSYVSELSAFSKTLHNLGYGVISFKSPSRKDRPLYLVHGEGLKTNQGDIQVLFAKNQIGTRHPELYTEDFEFLINEARKQPQVLITASKPYKWNRHALEQVDAIEVHNGLDTEENNRESQAIALEMNKPGIIVSNSKCLLDLGKSFTTIPLNNNNPKAYDYLIQVFALAVKRNLKNPNPTGRRATSRLSQAVTWLAIKEVNFTGNKN